MLFRKIQFWVKIRRKITFWSKITYNSQDVLQPKYMKSGVTFTGLILGEAS